MTIEEIYQNVDSIMIRHMMINNDAMKITQSWNLNGFKRWHRCLQRFFMENSICLENKMFDYYRKILKVDVSVVTYNPADIQSHLMSWKNTIDTDLQILGNLNKEHFNAVGVENEIIKCVIKKLIKIQEKLNRYIEKFNKTNWDWQYLYLCDSELHSKMKEKEKEMGYEY